MNTELLWGETETRDGVAIFGPHGVSAASRTRPGTSSGVYLIRSGDEALLVDTGRRTAPEYPTGVLDTICDVIDERDVRLRYVVQTHFTTITSAIHSISRTATGRRCSVTHRIDP